MIFFITIKNIVYLIMIMIIYFVLVYIVGFSTYLSNLLGPVARSVPISLSHCRYITIIKYFLEDWIALQKQGLSLSRIYRDKCFLSPMSNQICTHSTSATYPSGSFSCHIYLIPPSSKPLLYPKSTANHQLLMPNQLPSQSLHCTIIPHLHLLFVFSCFFLTLTVCPIVLFFFFLILILPTSHPAALVLLIFKLHI